MFRNERERERERERGRPREREREGERERENLGETSYSEYAKPEEEICVSETGNKWLVWVAL